MPTEHDEELSDSVESVTGDRPVYPTATSTGSPSRPSPHRTGETATATSEPTRIVYTEDGPALVDGPVELVTADGAVVRSDRFCVALCLCKRSRTYPLCDTSHRRRRRGDR